LKGYRLFWYSNEQSGTENGNLDLSLCNVGEVLDDCYFIIGAGYIDKQYKIVCKGGVHEARAWVKAISNAIESAQKTLAKRKDTLEVDEESDVIQEGWLEKKRKKEIFCFERLPSTVV